MPKRGLKQFIINQNDLERIKGLRGHPFFERKLSEAIERVGHQVENGIEKWEGNKTSHNKSKEYLNLLDMGLIYLITGDKKYEKACVRDVMTFIEVGEANGELAMTESKIEQTTVNKSILFIYDWLRDSFSPKEQDRIRKVVQFAIPRHMLALGQWSIKGKLLQNHYLADSVGVAEVYSYFNDLPDAKRWREFATDIAIQYMKDAFYADGVQNELTPSYHNFCLHLGITLAQVLKTYTDRDLFKEDWFKETYEKAFEWMSSLYTPDNGVVAFNDCHPNIPSTMFRLAASWFKNSHFQWLADNFGDQPQPNDHLEVRNAERRLGGDFFYSALYFDPTVPAKREIDIKKIFPEGGTACFRKIKEDSEGLIAQKVGRYTGGHAHADRLCFDYWYNNIQLLSDPGVVNQASMSGMGWFKSTTSHNALAIYEPHELTRWNSDEKFPRAHKNHRYAQGRFLETIDNDNYSVLVSTAEIYAGKEQTRLICWVKDSGLLLVADKLNSKEEESLTWDQMFHGVGELNIDKDSFLFKNKVANLKGFNLNSTGEVIAIDVPEGIDGPKQYAAIRNQKSSFYTASLVIPFKEGEPEPNLPNQSDKGFDLGANLKFISNDSGGQLLDGDKTIWEF